jgi:sugar phosphate permease
MMICIPIVGRLYPRIGPRRLVSSGLLGASLVALAFIQLDIGTSLWWIRGLMFFRGGFMSFAFIPLQAATYANISGRDTGRASALYSTQRQVGGALGVAALATVWIGRTKALTAGLTSSPAIRSARVSGFHDAFIATAVLALIASVMALSIRDRDAAATLPRLFPPEGSDPAVPREAVVVAAH